MQIFAVLCLAALALAKPQSYNKYSKGAVTTVTERTFTVHGDAQSDADKYYNNNAYSSGLYGGVSSYSANAQPAYSFETVASAVPYAQQQAYEAYQYQAPALSYQQAAYQAPALAYQQAAYQAPALAYHQTTYSAAPAVTSYSAAPAVAYETATAAPAFAYQAATAAPAIAYQTATAAPAIAYQTATAAPVVAYTAAPAVAYQNNYENNYQSSFQNSQISGADTKIFKHVYAFAAPEEPAARASVRVEAPVSKRKHYKLVFIKAPSQQTVLDSDILLPAQEEEKTLIYVLSKNQKQLQPEIRIKQAAASKHAKPEVFFLKYKNEAEAQAIANGAISGQNADVPAQGEIISDGSVSLLGQSGASSSSYASGASFAKQAGASNIVYRGGFASANPGLSAVSAGSVGIVSSPVVSTTVAPTLYLNADAPAVASGYAASGYAIPSFGSAGLSGGFSAYSGRSNGFAAANEEPASVAIKVTSEPSDILEATTAVPL